MEMLERCPGCSVAREVEAKKAKAETGPTFISSSRRSRPCVNCGYDGQFLPPDADSSSARDSLPSFPGARAKLATATQDLFRLSGSHSLPSSNSIPVEASVSEPPPRAPEAPASSSRKPEASIMFSLEALMKANQAPPKPGGGADEASNQFWNMQTSEPLFGTAADDALLTTPLKMEPAQSMDSMTLPSETPNARRWWPIALAATAGLALAAGGIWVFGSGSAAVSPPTPASEQAAIEAQPPVEAPPVLPAPGEHATAALPSPSEPQAAAPTPPSAAPTPDALGDAPGTSAPAGVAAVPPTPPVESAKEKDKDKPSARKPAARASAPRVVAAPVVSSKALVPFDKAAAKAALNGAAAQAASCGAGGAPGKGKIQVTFAPSGKVSDAQLVEGPFAGTTAGKCALGQFRAAKVPAFGGAPVTVAKSFKVD